MGASIARYLSESRAWFAHRKRQPPSLRPVVQNNYVTVNAALDPERTARAVVKRIETWAARA
jgi:hypothetical protein